MKKVIVLMCFLMIATTAFGYGLDGTLDSADFTNQLGPYSDYATWSFEGGTVANPMLDGLGNATISAYNAQFTSDGDIQNTDSANSSGSGMYRNFGSETYVPTGSGGYTYEWRMQIPYLGTSVAGNGLRFGFEADQAETVGISIKGGYYYNVENAPDYQKYAFVNYNGGSADLPFRTDEWHTYRVVVLGEDPGTGIIKANFYQDTTLVIEEFNAGTIGNSAAENYFWMGVSGYQELYHLTMNTDYVRIDTTGAYAPVPEPATMLLLLGGGLLSLRKRK